jgi:hypothetical protein
LKIFEIHPHLTFFFQAALLVAFINIQLPLYLGNIINILAKFTQDSTAQLSFMSEMKEPALKLVGLYVAQVKFEWVSMDLCYAVVQCQGT